MKLQIKYRSLYHILLFIMWTRYTAWMYIRVILSHIPVVGEFVVSYMIVIGVIFVGAVLASHFRYGLSGMDIAFYWGCCLILIVMYAFSTVGAEYFKELWPQTIFFAIPCYFLGIIFDIEKDGRCLFWFSIVSIGLVALYRVYAFLNGKIIMRDDMGTAYGVLPSVLYIIYYSQILRKWLYIIVAILSTVMLLMFGSRGPLLCIFIFLVLSFAYYVLQERISTRKIITVLLLISICIIVLNESVYMAIINALRDFFGQIGVSTRVLDLLVGGELNVSKGRNMIQETIIESVNKRPFLGYGIFADRALSGTGEYAHNLIIELWCDFGYVIGSLLAASMFLISILGFFKSWKCKKMALFLLTMICAVFIKLTFSGSYLTEQQLFFLLGIAVSSNRNPVDLTKTTERIVYEQNSRVS